MQSREAEEAGGRDYSEDDLALYRRMGYKHNPGTLMYIPEKRDRALYRSWEELIMNTSPWVESLCDPEERFRYFVRMGWQKPEKEEQWLQIKAEHEREIASHLQEAASVGIEICLDSKNLLSTDYFRFNPDDESLPEFYPTQLGALIAVSKPSRQDAIFLANAVPWGRNGGLQRLANIVKKPVIADAGQNMSMEFLPSLEAFSR